MNISKNTFYTTIILILVINVGFLIYYAYLIPLHIDEAGWWFNYTNKSWQNRFDTLDPADQFNGPFHTLSTYLAKLTLPIFGQNGIGWRMPVIAFGLLNCWITYYFVKTITNSRKTAGLGAAFTLLNPFLNQYAHESRSYIILFFLSTCSYFCLIGLFGTSQKKKYWVFLFLIFLLSYVATLSSIVFLFIFMATLWIFKILHHYTPLANFTDSLTNIRFPHLIIFSIFVTLFFVYLVFYVDYSAYSVGRYYQGNKPANLIAIPDFFSAFLGYKYLDDESSVLYHYPVGIYGICVFCFAIGFIHSFREKQIQTYFFTALFLTTAGFYIFSGSYIYTRTAVFLTPFLILYQATGTVLLIEAFLCRLFDREQAINISFWVLSGVVIFYCTAFNFGKYRNLEPDSGNPYELAHNYLKNNTGLNDLIISSLHDTVGGFYFGDMIREKNFNIYKNGRIENIYYLTPKTGESKIELEMVYPASKKIRFFPLDQFKPIVFFENKGVRPSAVHIFKRKVEIYPVVDLNQSDLLIPGYYGNYKKVCNTQVDGQGIRVKCYGSNMSCANHLLTLSVKKIDLQFILFHHINDRGTKTVSYASMKSMDQSEKSRKENQDFTLLPDVYRFNPLVNNINDLDIHRKKVDLVDVSLQKMGDGKNTLFCMVGSLFEGNSLINGVKVFNWKQ